MQISSFILPTTIPQKGALRQLLLFFDEIVMYAPAEDCIDPKNKIIDGLRHYAPIPFGSELDKFQQLIANILKSPAEYYGGGISALSSKLTTDLDESAVWRLINHLSPENAATNKEDETRFQARLLLKLSEVLKEKGDRIDLDLHSIESRSDTLMSKLRGEDSDREERKDKIIQGIKPATSDPRLLKAWSYLYITELEQKTSPNDPTTPWLISPSLEDFEYISDHASSLLNDSPKRLFSLELPSSSINDLSDDEYKKLRNKFLATNLTREPILETLWQAAQTGKFPLGEQFNDHLKDWGNAIFSHHNNHQPFSTLEFYLLPASLPEIFCRITKTSLPQTTITYPAHGIAAIFRNPQL